MAGNNRRKALPGTLPDSLQPPAAGAAALDQARALAARLDRQQELIDAAAEEQSFQGEVAKRFRRLGAGDVLRLWESGKNEQGRKLSKVEVMALGEQWAALTGQPGLPNLGSATAPSSQPAPATPPVPVPADDTAISMREVTRLTGLGKSTIKRKVASNKFPKPTKVSTRRIVWKAGVVKAWLAEREAVSVYMPSRGADRRRLN